MRRAAFVAGGRSAAGRCSSCAVVLLVVRRVIHSTSGYSRRPRPQ